MASSSFQTCSPPLNLSVFICVHPWQICIPLHHHPLSSVAIIRPFIRAHHPSSYPWRSSVAGLINLGSTDTNGSQLIVGEFRQTAQQEITSPVFVLNGIQ